MKMRVQLLAILSAALSIGSAARTVQADEITIEDNWVSVSFDSDSGALTRLVDKSTHWTIERRPQLGDSFRLFAPLPNRRYNPVFGQDQRAAMVRKVSDHQIEMQWTNLISQNGGPLPMTLTANVTLSNGSLTFAAILKNDSPLTVETMDYPYFGDLKPPSRDSMLTAYTKQKNELQPDELYPHFRNEKGYWGVNYPTKMLEPQHSHFCLIQSANEGMYVGTIGPQSYRVQYVFEQHPGVISGVTDLVPRQDEISGWPVHLDFRVCHFLFAHPHTTTALTPVVLRCYEGDPQQGADPSKSQPQ